MTDKALKLTWRMILNTMTGRREAVWGLYERYIKETRLHVPIREILEAKETA